MGSLLRQIDSIISNFPSAFLLHVSNLVTGLLNMGDNLINERYGMFTFQPESDKSNVDIIAVHGLGGHYDETWTWNPERSTNERPCNWLRDLLPNDIPSARIMSFGYDSAVALSTSVGDISIFGEQLLQFVRLRREAEQQRRRPIIFVCHSLGGIVVKKV
jgi:hypothetical protein